MKGGGDRLHRRRRRLLCREVTETRVDGLLYAAISSHKYLVPVCERTAKLIHCLSRSEGPILNKHRQRIQG